ncbi:hypothetical protein B7R78_0017245 [Ralstonia solanacearum]|uniref:Lipoprotein transmembrane n=1 Tax=Ralstonia solanacearum K60 TaxID=1091042 RepID=A0AAP8D541_RALSL|nr:hypothetical protein [Ralstonia solanacearum]MBT1538787.1 hypothetical protein [Ralstonia solanacearum]OYQ14347.1 hypothetical protein B7R77_14510 [Ralstonia solanacearum K60]CCF98756.1 conserved exported hypothetical protein [Ralstonia solanacearum K60]
MRFSTSTPLHRAIAIAVAATAVAFTGCASTGASRFDVDSFLTAPDTVLAEALVNKDFLRATQLSAGECNALVTGHASQVVPIPAPADARLPEAAARQPFVIQPRASESVWLLLRSADGSQSCHGPLPASEFMGLVRRAAN